MTRRWAAAVGVAALVACGPTRADGRCGASLPGKPRTVESSRYVVAFATTPDPIAVSRHFVVDFAVCPRGDAGAPESVRIDAAMPEHRHGMNYRPGVTTVSPGIYRAEGLLFHMPGRWDITFDLVAADRTERLTSTLRVE
jgi:hypothetical protein